MRVLSYNLDCNLSSHLERLKLFLDQVKETNPDVVAIQEGTKKIYEVLFREMGKLNYKFNFISEIRNKFKGELIFSKYKIIETKYIPFQYTKQDKGLTVCQIKVKGVDIITISCQFEEDQNIRKKQIDQLLNIDSSGKNIISMVDTRIKDYQDEIDLSKKGWFDAWEEEGCNSEKYTMDYTKNMWAGHLCRDRFDRIWFLPGTEDVIECEKYKLIGITNEPIESSIGIASSHFGVLSDFKFSSQDFVDSN